MSNIFNLPFRAIHRLSDSDILDPTAVVLPTLPTDEQSLLRHLEKSDPVSLALARDWDDTAQKLQKTRLKIEK
jgi:U3 small nucleolar RNA-associated protein 3